VGALSLADRLEDETAGALAMGLGFGELAEQGGCASARQL
jgi:hypothetical protein